tara:strand:+ start:147 stop:536 length:390 start_codon:yes stop_codon:yes gene_type:complete
LIPIIYLELGRPKDLLKAFLNLLTGLILIIKNKTIDESFLMILLVLTVLFAFYAFELFSYRWNQLTDKEKTKLATFLEFKNNLLKILEAIRIGARNFSKPLSFFNYDRENKKISPKKWVRNDKNDSINI